MQLKPRQKPITICEIKRLEALAMFYRV
jgi:hypothetical protein